MSIQMESPTLATPSRDPGVDAGNDQDWQALEWVDLARVKLDLAWSHRLPAAAARRYRILALCQIGEEVIVATSNPRLAAVREYLRKSLDRPVRLVRSDEAAVRRVLGQVYPTQVTASHAEPQEADGRETVELSDGILRAACVRGASDIHLVPGEEGLWVRFRVDGVLENFRLIPAHQQAGLSSRIKVLAGLDIAEKRKPQDGRFTLAAGPSNAAFDIRVATIPTRYGERITMRLLMPMDGAPSLAELGMGPREHELFARAIERPNGLVLLTGPTGCGKSTTLYAAISQLLRTRGGNIITVEDPIEYEIPGTTQVEVDAAEKVTFARALRSILRHDPDVIMLGEIRDAETAELAIKASLTGHLVFSTLHTNTAAGAVTRLVDMGVEPYLIAATLRLSVAQRLVRRLCQHCKAEVAIDPATAMALGDNALEGSEAFAACGCVYCAGKGFAGRTAVFEMLAGGDDVADLIVGGGGERELLRHMRLSGQTMLIDDGLDKIRSGLTTPEQVINAVVMG